jgi:hypothetical protein
MTPQSAVLCGDIIRASRRPPKRISGSGDLWVTEYTITYDGRPFYTVSMTEFRAGKVVHETQYFAEPFPSGMAWRFGLSDALMPNRSQSEGGSASRRPTV